MKRLVSWLRRKSADTMFVGVGLAFLVAFVGVGVAFLVALVIDWLIEDI
jgi:uncharacterized membrane protein YgaE (UPF0421/DUF939 family)